MTFLKTAILSKMQKEVLRQCIFKYVSDVQRKYYKTKSLTHDEYEECMSTISEIVDVLHLNEQYV
jgi:hypothetical protein